MSMAATARLVPPPALESSRRLPASTGGVGRQLRATHLEMVDAVVGGHGLPAIAAIAGRVTGADVAIAAPRMGPPAVSDSAVEESTIAALTRYVTSRLNARP